MSGIHRLTGQLRRYDWGGRKFIPELLGERPDGRPAAEYWLGAHASAPAQVHLESGPAPLDELIRRHPDRWLGDAAAHGDLPFLLKVLDVAAPLSIQVHPDREQARAGFERESAAGIPLNARERNFRDPNPKPELALALDDFRLLYGFRDEAAIGADLAVHGSLSPLADMLARRGLEAAFGAVMEANGAELEGWLGPLFDTPPGEREADPGQPLYWIQRWARVSDGAKRNDRGVLGFFFMNLVHLQPGQAIFQAANVPHAYLSGRIIEIMGNSDNVLRCGLTSKHVDPAALTAHLDFRRGAPSVIAAQEHARGGIEYPCPAEEFRLACLGPGQQTAGTTRAPEIWLVVAGECRLRSGGHSLRATRGQALLLAPGTAFEAEADRSGQVFIARWPD